MDWLKEQKNTVEWIKKYRYLILLLCIGIIFMAIPEKEQHKEEILPQETEPTENLQEELEGILSQVAGAGRVALLLTQKQGETIIFQQDVDQSEKTRHAETVIVSGSDQKKEGLICQTNAPVYRGAVVLCQGADSALVRLSITEAIMSATGLTANCITVLKME